MDEQRLTELRLSSLALFSDGSSAWLASDEVYSSVRRFGELCRELEQFPTPFAVEGIVRELSIIDGLAPKADRDHGVVGLIAKNQLLLRFLLDRRFPFCSGLRNILEETHELILAMSLSQRLSRAFVSHGAIRGEGAALEALSVLHAKILVFEGKLISQNVFEILSISS